MGKSCKKSTPKVEAPAVTLASKPSKKGKREAEEALEKVENAKKQKKDDKVVAKVIEKKVEVKTQKKKKEESSSTSSDDSSSEEEPKVKTVTKKAVKPPAKESSSEEESSSSDEEPPTQKAALPPKKVQEHAKNGSVNAKKEEDSSSSESSDSSSEDEPDEDEVAPVKAAIPKNASAVAAKNKSESSETSDDSESDDSSEDEINTAKASVHAKTPAQAAKERNQKSDNDVTEDSSDDSDSSDEDIDSEADNEKTKKATLVAPKVQQSKNSNESRSESDFDDSDEEDDGSDEEDDGENDNLAKTKKDNDVEMVGAETAKKAFGQADLKSASKTPKTPATPGVETGGSMTLFMGNLPFDVERADIENFFKDVAEVVDIRLALDPDRRFKGFGHVEFATGEEAQKALQLDGQNLSGRRIRLDLARERGAPGSYTPSSGKENTFQKGGRGQVHKIFVRGFDTSLPEEEIRNVLSSHFETCGEIGRISIPTDYETGAIRGMAYIEFKDADAFSNALGLNESQMGEYYLTVEEARPKLSDGRDGGWSGGRSGGRSGGGRGFDGRGRGGWERRGRGDGGRGFRGGRGQGGRGGGRGGRPNFTTAPAGKKKKFDDE